MISRTKLLRFLVTFLLVATGTLFTERATAKTDCRSTSDGRLCVSEVDLEGSARLSRSQIPRDWPQRSWVDCLSVIYRYYKHPIDELDILKQMYWGRTPSKTDTWSEMSKLATREWVDDRRRGFETSISVVYEFGRPNRFDDRSIIQELDEDRPVIIALLGAESRDFPPSYAVIMRSVQYLLTAEGLRILAVQVFDPNPPNGYRNLSQQEMRIGDLSGSMLFIGKVKVVDDTPAPSPSPTPLPAPTPAPSPKEIYDTNTLAYFDSLNQALQKRILLDRGPFYPAEFRITDYSLRGFVKGQWPITIEYGLEADSSVTLSIEAENATFSQTFVNARKTEAKTISAMNENGSIRKVSIMRNKVSLVLPNDFGKEVRVGKISFKIRKNGRETRNAFFRVYAFNVGNFDSRIATIPWQGAAYLPASFSFVQTTEYWFSSGTVIDQVLLNPVAIKTQLSEKFRYKFHSITDLSRLSATFFQDYVDEAGVLASRQVHFQRLKAIRRNEWSPEFTWDGRVQGGGASKGLHQLQLRGWTGSVRDGS